MDVDGERSFTIITGPDPLAPMGPTLIYDGDCGYCSAVAGIASRGGIETLPYESDEAQELLSVFDEPGFTLYLFDGRTVHWGSHAAEEVASRLHVPYPIVRLLGRMYPAIVRVVSVLTRRERSVGGPSCDCGVTVSEDGSGGRIELDEAV
jgi:predicted DCC family thiol-disulfide oxidoreductase YuxK